LTNSVRRRHFIQCTSPPRPFSASFEKHVDTLRKTIAANRNVAHSLRCWSGRQRRLRKAGALPAERVEALDDIGFIWDPRGARWETRLDELARRFERDGHCAMSSDEDRALAAWCSYQRTLYRKGLLQKEQALALYLLYRLYLLHLHACCACCACCACFACRTCRACRTCCASN
jgi:hypothetical protein